MFKKKEKGIIEAEGLKLRIEKDGDYFYIEVIEPKGLTYNAGYEMNDGTLRLMISDKREQEVVI